MRVSESVCDAIPDVETRTVEYLRDEAGTLFAVERIEGPLWRAEFAREPAAAVADVRVVRVRRGAPAITPPWLQVAALPRGVADLEAAYVLDRGPAGGAVERRLWAASPHWRSDRAPFEEYLDAGVAALSAAGTPPGASTEGSLDVLRSGIGALTLDDEPWRTAVACRSADECERWLQVSFDTPDALADELLLERLSAEGEGEAARLLRFLRGAAIVEDEPDRVELAVDRRALIEQATPWRHFEQGDLASALPAVRAWMTRYRVAYERWYRRAFAALDATRAQLAAAEARGQMLARLDGIEALGSPDGHGGGLRLERAAAALASLPAAAAPDAATTAGLALGGSFALAAEVADAVAEIEAAADRRGRRLAGALASLVMGRADVAPLDRVLQALLASDIDDLDRVLNVEVVAQIESLLGAEDASKRPLAQLAERHPRVTAGTLEAALVSLREILEGALAKDDSVLLR